MLLGAAWALSESKVTMGRLLFVACMRFYAGGGRLVAAAS
jgi:hypothetical protein